MIFMITKTLCINQNLFQIQMQQNDADNDPNQLKQLLQFTHLGAKFTKNQISSISLPVLVKQLSQQSLREFSNYLEGFSLCLVKQYSHLRADVHCLQQSLTEEDQQKVRQQKNDSPQKRTKKLQNLPSKNPLQDFKESTTSSIDNPRNVASRDKITLEQEPEMFNAPMIDSDSQSADIFNNMNILEEVRSLENKSIKELIRQEPNTPSAARVIFTEPDDQQLQMSPPPKNLLMQFDSIGKKISYEEDLQDKENDLLMNRQIRRGKKGMNNLIIDEQLQEDKVFNDNIQQLTLYQTKLDDINLKMNLLNIHQEFWNERDNLMSLVEQNTSSMEETELGRRSVHETNDPFVTTIVDSKKIDDQSKFAISEFYDDGQGEFSFYVQDQRQSVIQSEKKKSLKNDEEVVYNKIQREIFKSSKKISSQKYFDIRQNQGVGKAGAFYDLLVMSRIGKLHINSDKTQGMFTTMQIEFN